MAQKKVKLEVPILLIAQEDAKEHWRVETIDTFYDSIRDVLLDNV